MIQTFKKTKKVIPFKRISQIQQSKGHWCSSDNGIGTAAIAENPYATVCLWGTSTLYMFCLGSVALSLGILYSVVSGNFPSWHGISFALMAILVVANHKSRQIGTEQF